MRIGVDLMGSDTAPQVLFEAILQATDLLQSDDALIVFATEAVLNSLKTSSHPKIKWCVSADFISMSDEPLVAVRQKKKSSLILGIKDLKKKSLDAFISAGNTGALVASATLYLNKFLKANRPALLALLPTEKGSVAVIDVGGNISCRAEHLMQFAEMGAIYQSCYSNIARPKVGLLNIGTESKKGTLEVRQAYEMLQNSHIQDFEFIGNIEGRDVFDGKADVVVTSGVTGNVLLKTAEGVSSFIFDSLKHEENLLTTTGKKAIDNVQKQFSYAEYPGALITGVDGIVIKCHGFASARAMYTSIKGAITLCQKDFLSQIKTQIVKKKEE